MSFLQPGTSSRKNVTFLYTQFSLLITKLNQKRGKKRSVWFQQFFCQIVTKQWNRNRNRNVVRKSLRLIKIINYISKICSIIRNERRDSNRTFSIHFDIYLPSSMMSGQLMCERSFYSAKRLSSKAILSYFVVGYASMRKHQRWRRLLVNFNSKKITTKFWRFYGLCFFWLFANFSYQKLVLSSRKFVQSFEMCPNFSSFFLRELADEFVQEEEEEENEGLAGLIARRKWPAKTIVQLIAIALCSLVWLGKSLRRV